MDGRTVLITGGGSGLGKAAAIQLSALGARVVILVRNEEQGKAALSELRGPEGGVVVAELGSLDSVRKAAEDFKARFGRLDVLINNAALNTQTRQTTQDGFELHFGVNYLAHYLLTRLLLDSLLKSAPAPARIISVGGTQLGATIDFDDLQLTRRWAPMRSVTRAKMGLFLMTRELARRYRPSQLTANALDPGLVKTPYHRGAGLSQRLAVSLIGKAPEEAVRTHVHLASSPEVASVTGGFFANMKQRAFKGQALDDAAAARLWDESARLVRLPA